MGKAYETTQPERSAIDAMPGTVALEFGTGWCGYCRSAEQHITSALAASPSVTHIKVEDGPGRPLGRSFRVKLWPTVVVIKDGKELARVVRPADANEVRQAIAQAEKD
ncbi:thioredoxin family protein [Massilia soli]|uniref:Thioredoxin family protein n=1 Tax=Massilia soli TaxID=2792854 RepID=A0ABS7SQ24_9BURK|nr:thioredoxin family protein [Massilia soli]MBZ2208197.1 thioredoxin family protein [Massilia soli]